MAEPRLARQAAVRTRLAERHLEVLLVTHLPNIRWLTGFTGSAAILVLTPERARLFTDFRYAVQAPQEAGTVADVQVERASVWGRVRGLLRERGWGRIGFEGHLLPAREADRLRGELSGSLVDAGEVVEGLRQVKDADEVAAIRAAATLAQDALAEVLPTVRVGERELDLASRLEAALRRRGSEWHPFE